MKRVKLTVAMLSILLVPVVLNLYQATYNPDIPRQKGEAYWASKEYFIEAVKKSIYYRRRKYIEEWWHACMDLVL